VETLNESRTSVRHYCMEASLWQELTATSAKLSFDLVRVCRNERNW